MTKLIYKNSKFIELDKLNKLYLIINKKKSKYPFNINDDPLFTQNEMILHYKSNYLLSDNPNTSKSGGITNNVSIYEYV